MPAQYSLVHGCSVCDTLRLMRARQRRTLERLFSKPTPANIRWREVVSLLDALNFEITEGRSGSREIVQGAGSRVRLESGAQTAW